MCDNGPATFFILKHHRSGDLYDYVEEAKGGSSVFNTNIAYAQRFPTREALDQAAKLIPVRLLVEPLKADLIDSLMGIREMYRLNHAWERAGSPQAGNDSAWRVIADYYGGSDNALLRIRGKLRERPLNSAPFSLEEIHELEARFHSQHRPVTVETI
jgi:hypothetical protein